MDTWKECLATAIEEEEMFYTENLHEALWILPDGQLISGEFEMGYRGADHRDIGTLTSIDVQEEPKAFWGYFLNELSFVMVIPEEQTLLMDADATLTSLQEEVIRQYTEEGYEVSTEKAVN